MVNGHRRDGIFCRSLHFNLCVLAVDDIKESAVVDLYDQFSASQNPTQLLTNTYDLRYLLMRF